MTCSFRFSVNYTVHISSYRSARQLLRELASYKKHVSVHSLDSSLTLWLFLISYFIADSRNAGFDTSKDIYWNITVHIRARVFKY